MRSQEIVSQILYADSLLSMDGIIPSVSLWHENMQRQVLRLQQALQADGASPEQAARFCWLLCELLDKRMNTLRVKHRWGEPNYSLASYLYGQSETDVSLTERLRESAQGKPAAIASLSRMLLGWMSLREGGVQSVRIHADWHEEPAAVPAPAPQRRERVSSRFASVLWMSLSALFLVSLWFFLKAYSHG